MQKESEEYIVNTQSGKSFRMSKGDSIRIIDIEGKQVADFWAIRNDHLDEFFSPGVTIDCNESLYITQGAYLYTNLYRPMFLIETDDVGRHDLLHPCCRPEMALQCTRILKYGTINYTSEDRERIKNQSFVISVLGCGDTQ